MKIEIDHKCYQVSIQLKIFEIFEMFRIKLNTKFQLFSILRITWF